MILVPASADLAAEVAENGKGSILAQVLGAVTTEAVARAKAAWEEDNSDAIAELEVVSQGQSCGSNHGS